MDKSTSMSSKLQNTLSDSTITNLTLDTSMGLLPLDYNVVDDMKKKHVNIIFFELAKIQS